MSEKNSLFEQLQSKFKTGNVAPYGQVCIIPVKDFETGWKEELLKENIKIFSNSYYNELCFFLKKSEKSPQKAEPISPSPEPRQWTHEEKALLLKLYSQGISGKRIAKKLNRSTQEIGAFVRHHVPESMRRPSRKSVWTDEQENLLKELQLQGLKPKEIAKRMNKSIYSIAAKTRHHLNQSKERAKIKTHRD